VSADRDGAQTSRSHNAFAGSASFAALRAPSCTYLVDNERTFIRTRVYSRVTRDSCLSASTVLIFLYFSVFFRIFPEDERETRMRAFASLLILRICESQTTRVTYNILISGSLSLSLSPSLPPHILSLPLTPPSPPLSLSLSLSLSRSDIGLPDYVSIRLRRQSSVKLASNKREPTIAIVDARQE